MKGMLSNLTKCCALLLLTSLLSLGICHSVLAQETPQTTALNIKFVNGLFPAEQETVVTQFGGVVKSSVPQLNLVTADFPSATLPDIIASLNANPSVIRVEVDSTRKVEAFPNDTLFYNQWPLLKIGWDQVYGVMTPAPGTAVKVAILDTGIDALHPDLAGNVVAGTSILDGSNGMTDPNGHGTWLAGIVGANTHNNEGIAGVAFAGVQMMPVQVIGANGEGQDSDVIAGVMWAADHGADVILMGFSNPGRSYSLQDAIDYAWSKNIVLVAAVGNDALNAPTFPAGDRGVIGVAATDSNDVLAPFSNLGSAVFLAAPGVDTYSTTLQNGYVGVSGTSGSSAIVAGVAAFMRAMDPTLSNGVIVNRLAVSADPAGTQEQTGNGRVNMASALQNTSIDAIQPAGSDAGGGPFVGPYRLANTRSLFITFNGSGGGSVQIKVTNGKSGDNVYLGTCPGIGSGTPTATISATCLNIQLTAKSGNPDIQLLAMPDTNSVFGGWTSSLGNCLNPTTNPCSATNVNSNSAVTTSFNPAPASKLAITSVNGDMDATFGIAFSVVIQSQNSAGTPTNVLNDTGFTLSVNTGSGFISGTVSGTITNGTNSVTITGVMYSKAENAVVLAATRASGDNLASGSSSSFNVLKATSTVTVTCPASQTYTGSAIAPCTAKATGVGMSDVDVTSSLVYSNNTNVGPASASASWAGDDNHTGNSGSGGFEITKATSTVIVTCPASQTYTGSAIAPCTAKATGVGMSDVDVTSSLVYSNNTNVGPASASASWAGDDNHTGNSGSGGFEITKATSTVIVTCPASQTYTGSAIAPCTAKATGVGMSDVDVTSSLVYSNNTNVGPASASASWAGDDNHTGNSGSGGFEITKATSTVIVTCPASQTYTGSAIAPCTAKATGVGMSDVDVTSSLVYSNNTSVGPASASASWAGDDNHTGNSGSGGFEITKATSTVIVTCPASQTYTGSAIAPCTAKATGVGMSDVDVTSSLVYSNNTSVGPASASASWAGDDNHTGNSGSGGFEITKATSTVIVTCPASQTYTGSAIAPCTAKATGVGMSDVDVTSSLVYSNNTNVGPASASASWAGDDNHTGNSGSGGFEITKATSTVIVTCPASQTYTGSAIAPCTAKATGVGMSDVDVTSSLVYSNNTNVGPASASASWAGDDNHTGNSGSGGFEITKATSTVIVTCPASQTYTGSAIAPCTAKATGVGMSDVDVTSSLVYSNNTNVGPASASASWAGDDNHTGNSGSGGFEITKATSTVIVTCPASQTYTGSAIAPCTAKATGVGMSDVDVTSSLVYSNNTSVGPASASASWAGDDNHTGNSGSGGFEITKATSTVIVTCPASQTYTGSAIAPCTAKATGVGMSDVDVTSSLVYSNNTNVGPASASASWAGDDNHTGNSGSGGFEITKATSTVIVTCPASQTYTGSAIAPCTAKATGVGMSDVDVTSSLVYSNNTNVGPASASASWAGDDNHTGNSGSGGFEITKATSTVIVTCPASQTYTGSAIAPCTAKATGVGMSDVDVTSSLVYSNNTNVGPASASASWAGDDNHTGNSGSGGFEITKATSTVIVTCPASQTYTGSAIAPCTAKATGVGMSDVDVTSSLVYSNNTNVGPASASASWAGDDNHTGNSGSGGFEITKATSTVIVTCPASQTYTGSAIAPCTAKATGVGMSDVDVTSSLVYSNNTSVGPASASASWAGDDNHTGNSGSGGFEITKATSTVIVTCPASQTYTGSAIAPCTAKATGVGMSDVDVTSSLVYSNNTNVGPASASASWAGDDNHTGNSGSGGFEITKATSTVIVTCPASQTYTGSAIAPCTAKATGVGMSDVDVTSSLVYSNNTSVGTASASASWSGDANYTGSSDSKNFTIDKAAITVAANNKAMTYGGTVPTFDGSLAGVAGSDGITASYASPAGAAAGYAYSAAGYPIVPTLSDPNNKLGNYTVASTNSTLTVNKAEQAITVTTHAPVNAAFNASFTVVATGGASGLPVTFSSSSLSICTNSGPTFTMISSTGTCAVQYDQAGNTNYNAAPQIIESVTAQKAGQSITFVALSGKTFGDPDFTVSATANSGLDVSFVASGNCTVTGNSVHITGAGSCMITASQAGNSNYKPATDVPQSFIISKAAGSVSINNIPVTATFGGSFTPAFTKLGDGTASVASLTTSICTVTSGVVNYVGSGTCTLQASVTEGTNYLAATGAGQSFTISKAAGSVSISNIPSTAASGGSFTPTFTKSGDGATSVASLTASTCTVTAGVVNYVGAGTCTLQASVAAGTNHQAATGAQQGFTITGSATTKFIIPIDVAIHTVDQKRWGWCGNDLFGRFRGECKNKPEELLDIEIYKIDTLKGTKYGSNPDNSRYDDIFADSSIVPDATCKTDAWGEALCYVPAKVDYLVIVKYTGIAHVKYPSRKTTLYAGRKVSAGSFQSKRTNTDFDGPLKNITATTDTLWAKDVDVHVGFHIIRTINKDRDDRNDRDGRCDYGDGNKNIYLGSYLEILYPGYTVWEEGVTGYVYPFILTGDTDWTVDVCAAVPQGYQIVGVYDIDGNLITTNSCAQAGVAGETKVIAFEVNDLQSPPPHLSAKLKIRHKGKDRKDQFEISGHRKGKDKKK